MTSPQSQALKAKTKMALRRLGVEIGSYSNSFAARRQQLLGYHGVTTVIDVGANVGQYATGLRASGFTGKIVSFEPLTRPYTALQLASRADPLWDVERMALGAEDGTVTLQISEDDVFSSVLASTPKNHSANALTRTIGTEQAPVRRLDDVIDSSADTAVKIDVQGFEDQVVAGATAVLGEAPVLELELTLTPLYQGQWLIRDALGVMDELGFELALTENIMLDRASGRSLQINGIFVKSA
ncbi:MAG: FkbM family methyltransferase [Aquihabitans sp.]